jgi:predicted nucleic acid-binding protein
MVTNPKAKSLETQDCQQWFRSILRLGYIVVLPEIADYEVRRELLQANRSQAVNRLDQLKERAEYLPITTAVMRRAAELWAIARRTGLPTADPKALDGDVILVAQIIEFFSNHNEVVVATTNVKHLSRFITAQEWKTIH